MKYEKPTDKEVWDNATQYVEKLEARIKELEQENKSYSEQFDAANETIAEKDKEIERLKKENRIPFFQERSSNPKETTTLP